jgi:hypothetical protein
METLLGSSYRVTMELQWEAVFCMWSAPTLYHASDSTVSVQTTDPFSRQRERPTSTSLQLSNSNKDLVLSPRGVLYAKTDWPTKPSVVT